MLYTNIYFDHFKGVASSGSTGWDGHWEPVVAWKCANCVCMHVSMFMFSHSFILLHLLTRAVDWTISSFLPMAWIYYSFNKWSGCLNNYGYQASKESPTNCDSQKISLSLHKMQSMSVRNIIYEHKQPHSVPCLTFVIWAKAMTKQMTP